MQNLAVASHALCAHVGGPNFGDAGAPPPWDGNVADPRKNAPPRVLSRDVGSRSWSRVDWSWPWSRCRVFGRSRSPAERANRDRR